MLSVILAEDEPLVRIGMKNMPDWEALDMQVVRMAASGDEALAAWEETRAEIIVTDIKMPHISGLELCAAVRKRELAGEGKASTRFIILTCFEEFAFIQTAMELDTTAYLLKLTLRREDFERVLRKAAAEWSANTLPEHGANSRVLADQLLRDFILDRRMDAKAFCTAIRDAGVGLKLTDAASIHPRIYLIRLPEEFLSTSPDDPLGYRVRNTTADVLQKTLDDNAAGYVFFGTRDFAAVVTDGVEDEDACDALDAAFLSAVSRNFNLAARVTHSDAVTLAELPNAYAATLDGLADSAPFKINATLSFIAENYAHNISIADAAETLGITPGYLSHLLQKRKLSFGEALNKTRMEKAKRLLACPDIRVAEVGEKVGIPNATYFTRLFRRYTGKSPREYRREVGL